MISISAGEPVLSIHFNSSSRSLMCVMQVSGKRDIESGVGALKMAFYISNGCFPLESSEISRQT